MNCFAFYRCGCRSDSNRPPPIYKEPRIATLSVDAFDLTGALRAGLVVTACRCQPTARGGMDERKVSRRQAQTS